MATLEQIDRIARLGGGFRMGPFELMDLVGIDVGYEVARSFNEQSFGEPRWKPSMLQARMVAAGTLGRKTGRGWYSYEDGPHRPDDEDPPAPGGGDGRTVAIAGSGAVADGLRERARAAGYDAHESGEPELIVDATLGQTTQEGSAPRAVLCADSSLAAKAIPGAAGFHLLPPMNDTKLVELTRLPDTRDDAAEAAERFFTSLGHAPRVGGGRARARARPARVPAGERGAVRDRRGSRARPRTWTRAPRSGSTTRAAQWRGGARSASSTCLRRSMGSGGSAARSATDQPPCCNVSPPPASNP